MCMFSLTVENEISTSLQYIVLQEFNNNKFMVILTHMHLFYLRI